MSKEIVKKWTELIKSTSKANKWKFKEYFIFKTDGPFLFDAMIWINGKTNSLTGVLHFKLADIDSLLWKLTVENDSLDNYPLSLRVNGSHVVRPVSYYSFELKDISEKSLIDLLKTIDEKVAVVKEKFSNEENYLNYLREGKLINQYSYVTNLLFCKKYEELRLHIAHCRQNNISAGMTFYKNGVSEDYFDRVIKYMG